MLDFPHKPDIITFVLTREQNKKPRAQNKIAGLCKGSTTDSDSVCEGSNPSPAAKFETAETVAMQQFRRFSFILSPATPAGNLTLLRQFAGGNGGGKIRLNLLFLFVFRFLFRYYLVPRCVDRRLCGGQALEEDGGHIHTQGHHVLQDAGDLIDNVDGQDEPAQQLKER